jgi:hypothetical protein
VTPSSSSTSGQRAKQAGRTGSNGFSTKARPNIHAQRAERRGAAGGGFLLGLLGLGQQALGVLNLKTAVDGRKTPQVAVEIEQFERRSLADLELHRSRENRPESRANTRSALFGSHDNCGFLAEGTAGLRRSGSRRAWCG